jgi:hypothetical protein
VKIPSPRSGRILLGAVTIFAVVAGGMQRDQIVLAVASAQTPIDSNSNLNAQKEEQIRKLQQKEFIREHSDASGNLRPDLWRNGVEQQKKMQVAPYIGWHPSSAASPAAAK